MEHFNDREKVLWNIEKMVILVFSAYALHICYVGFRSEWEGWALTIILFGLIASWVAHVAKYKNYGTRSLITTMAISLTIFFYGVHAEDFTRILPTVFVLTGLVGLYGVLELVWIVGIILMFIVTRQCFLLWAQQQNLAAHANLLLQILNVGFYVLILALWVRGRVQNTRQGQIAMEERAAAEKARDDFVTNVSHEIRTPLNIIYGNAEIVQGETDIDRVHEHVNNIAVASRRLSGMVSDFLDYSELAYGEVSLEEEVYDITTTINDIVAMTMAQLEGKELEVLVDVDIHMPKLLLGDEKKIRRIVMNLVSNAIKFTASGYVLIKIGARKESYGINLTISVQDSGIGMSDEEIEKLFTMYNQADTKRNRRGDGIGLGIAISNLLAKKLGGVLSVHSKRGEGSVFKLVVPQKVVADDLLVPQKNMQNLSVAYCMNLESNEMVKVRDVYSEIIEHMISQFGVNAQVYRGSDDLKQRAGKLNFTHMFVSQTQYVEDPSFFDSLAERAKVVVIMDNVLQDGSMSPKIVRISKPFHSLQVAMVFSGEKLKDISTIMHHEMKFKAPNTKVLVVDDNQMNINVVKNLLKRYEIQVEQALSGAEALEKIGNMNYDFVFMDHMMPEMDGVETTHRIRQKYGTYFQKVPIVALTANAIAGSREMFLREGFTDFLEKPVEPSVLERILRRNINVTKQVELGSQGQITGGSSERQRDKEAGMDQMFAEHENTQKDVMEEMTVWNRIDRESGLLYCGGEEGYALIMAECVHTYPKMAAELEEAYRQKDIKMYTIKVHALKSTMKSIGALDLSEKAKELEFAGKEGRYEEIEEKHEKVAAEYYSLMKELSKLPMVMEQLEPDFAFDEETQKEKMTILSKPEKQSEAENAGEASPITAEQLKELQTSFENAMYTLDADGMKDVVKQLENRIFAGVNLTGLSEEMLLKINGDDYFAAGDLLLSLKTDEEGGTL